MHAVYLACLFGGSLATALFALLGTFGGAGHGHAGHTHTGQAHAGPGHTGQAHTSPVHASAHHTHHALGHPAPNAHSQAGARETLLQAQQATHSTGAIDGVGAPAARWHAPVGWTLSWFSPLSLAAAALWFGAGGVLGERFGAIALVVAIVAAVVGMMFVRMVMNAFIRASVEPLSLTAEGAIGTVNAAIRENGTGEVVFTLEGLQRSIPARSLDGQALPRGTSVVIVRREKGLAYVESLDPLPRVETQGAIAKAESAQSRQDGEMESEVIDRR